AEEELVDAVDRAICGELFKIEDLAVDDADRRDRDPVPGLEYVRLSVVRADLYPPGVAADARDLPAMDPVQRLEGQTRRGTAGIATPLALSQAILHLSRADDHKVGASYLDALRTRGPVEIGDRDGIAVVETVDALVASHIEQHAPADHLVRELLDAVLVRSAAVDERGRIAVPHLVAEEHVRQRIPLCSGLRRQIDGVIRVAQPRRHVVLARHSIGARRQHLVQRVPTSAEKATLRPVLVEIETEPKDLPLPHEFGGVDDVLGRDVVQDAQLVVGAPLAPVLEILGLLQHVGLRQSCHGFPPISVAVVVAHPTRSFSMTAGSGSTPSPGPCGTARQPFLSGWMASCIGFTAKSAS